MIIRVYFTIYFMIQVVIAFTPFIHAAVGNEREEYKEVTIKDVLSNMNAYDGQKIIVKGRYVLIEHREPRPACIQHGTGINPTILNVYKVAMQNWGISDSHRKIAAVLYSNGAEINTHLNYADGQEITLKGTARYMTIPTACNRDVHYESIYLRVDPKDVDVNLKPLPNFILRN